MLPRKELHCLVYNTMHKKMEFSIKDFFTKCDMFTTPSVVSNQNLVNNKNNKQWKINDKKKSKKNITLLTIFKNSFKSL